MSASIFRSEPDPAQAHCASIYTTHRFFRDEEVSPNAPILEQLCDFRLGLLSRGWEPIPVGGKNRLLKDWTKGIITPERIRAETSGRLLNTGFRTGQAVGIDNDLKNPEYAAGVDEIVEYFLGDRKSTRLN